LQEGSPSTINGNRLSILFSQEHEFQKESLEHNDNRALVERIFSDKLGSKVVLEFRMTDDAPPEAHEADEPMVRKALDAFGGKIVSKWHND